MGVAFVFVIYVTLVSLFALPLAALGSIAGRYISRRIPALKRRFMIAGALIPIAVGVYFIFCIVAMAIFGLSTGPDFGFGDGFDLRLNNGYHWSAIDEPVAACVYPGSSEDMSHFCGLPNFNTDVFIDVAALQERGDWLAGAFDSNNGHFLYPEQQRADRWFLFNTKTHQRYDAADEAALATLTAQHGFALKLELSSDFYEHHRYRWYDAAFVLLLLVPPFVVLLWLYKKARSLLREAAETAGPDVAETT